MAALSRPSLRSASRRNAGLELSATGTQRKSPTHIPRHWKRTRDLTLLNDESRAPKKQKIRLQELPRQVIAQGHNADCVVVPPNNSPKGVPTQGVISRNKKLEITRQDVSNVETSAIDSKSTPDGTANEVGVATVARKVDKRSLRSHDGGSRSKSELALYFHNYDEIVSIEPKVPDFLTGDTLIHITDDPVKSATLKLHPPTTPSNKSNSQSPSTDHLLATIAGSLQTSEQLDKDLTRLDDAQRLDFSSINCSANLLKEDPLTDAVYLKAHRRAERQEKQLRNIEKERAQHEKVQLERLLDGLKGHDWLRVMGISGITDSEKKMYEPKKEHLVQEVESLIDKFRAWKEEEKRRKLEKERKAEEDDEDESGDSGWEPPDDSDVDVWAARQLHREASSANGMHTGKSRMHRQQAANALPLPVDKPFTSFFSKPYLREAALGKHRRGRTTFAFGQPLPDLWEREFTLPSDLLTQDALNASARSRRRANRESREHRERPN